MDDLTIWVRVFAIQRKLVETAGAIVGKPRIILMDEGVGIQGLIVNYLMDVIVKIAKSSAVVLLIEQYTNIALKLAHWVYVLDQGVIRFGGLPAEVKVNARVLHGPYLAGNSIKSDQVKV